MFTTDEAVTGETFRNKITKIYLKKFLLRLFTQDTQLHPGMASTYYYSSVER